MTAEIPVHYKSEDILPGIIKAFASKHSLTIGEETLRGISIIFSSCSVVDDELDRCPDPLKRRCIFENLMNNLNGKEELMETGSYTSGAYHEAMGHLRHLLDTYPPQRKEIFLTRVRIWDRLSESQKHKRNTVELINERRVDLHLTGGIYLTALNDKERAHPKANKFVHEVKNMVRFAGMLDDLMDLQDDHKHGVTKMEPSVRNKLLLGGVAVREAMPILKYAVDPTFSRECFRIMKREFDRRKLETNSSQYS